MSDVVSAEMLDWARDLAAIRRMVEVERGAATGPVRGSVGVAAMGARPGVVVVMPTRR